MALLDNAWDRYHQASEDGKAVIEREICRLRMAIQMYDFRHNV